MLSVREQNDSEAVISYWFHSVTIPQSINRSSGGAIETMEKHSNVAVQVVIKLFLISETLFEVQ